MIKKIAVLVTALAILPLAGLFAQESGPSEENGFQIFSFDLIYGFVVDLPDFDSDVSVKPAFGLNFRFGSDFIVGFEMSTEGFKGLNLKYDINQSLRAAIYLGQDTFDTDPETAAGLGIEATIFSAKTALATDFRIGARYIFGVSDPSTGKLGINLILGLGV
jgi:hypothetical protein